MRIKMRFGSEVSFVNSYFYGKMYVLIVRRWHEPVFIPDDSVVACW